VEIWKDIEGFEGLYQVSNLGSVRSLAHRVRLIAHGVETTSLAGHEVLHLNHTPADNRLINLRYGTRSENLRMDYAAGSRKVHPNFISAGWRP